MIKVKQKLPKRFCTYRGCGKIHGNKGSYCDAHKHQVQGFVRKKASHKLYNNAAWRNYSIRYRGGKVCINFSVCYGKAEVVDHITPVEAGGEFWDEKNHQPMCHTCHNRKRQEERFLYQKTGEENL